MVTKTLVPPLLLLHAGLLGWCAVRDSPIWDEPGHLVAGISHWELGTFDLMRVNPPLVRVVAAVPLLVTARNDDWSRYDASVGARSERWTRGDFIAANGQRVFWLHTVARWACIPLSLLGACVCFAWARELYGPWAGILATAHCCFSPNIIRHGSLITPDAGTTAMGVAAAHLFWRWLKGPTWRRTVAAGLVLGLAELTKTTWIVLFGLWPVLWMVWKVTEAKAAGKRERGRRVQKAECIRQNERGDAGRGRWW